MQTPPPRFPFDACEPALKRSLWPGAFGPPLALHLKLLSAPPPPPQRTSSDSISSRRLLMVTMYPTPWNDSSACGRESAHWSVQVLCVRAMIGFEISQKMEIKCKSDVWSGRTDSVNSTSWPPAMGMARGGVLGGPPAVRREAQCRRSRRRECAGSGVPGGTFDEK